MSSHHTNFANWTPPIAEHCNCLPLSSLYNIVPPEQGKSENEPMVPITPFLSHQLRPLLDSLFPRSTPLSMLLLHVSQIEPTPVAPQSVFSHKKQRYHVASSLVEQILVNMRRVLRFDDQLLIHEGAGAVIIFPDVGREGAYSIVERVYHSISLLQAETVIPPLTRETTIALGIGSHLAPETSVETFLRHTGWLTRSLTLRPVISTGSTSVGTKRYCHHEDKDARSTKGLPSIPFLNLPEKLPARLTQLIPHDLACELRCAPVGRDHHALTVAMADPLDAEKRNRLQSVTGMTIFPVACKEEDLDALLANTW